MHHSPAVLISVLALGALAARASAQSFNLDVGSNISAPVPSPTYGAAALQPGFWSPVATTSGNPVALLDLNSNLPTSVTIQPSGGYGDFYDNSQAWPGDDRNLMADASDVANLAVPPSGGLITWTISGLSAGKYTIFTYALAPDFPASYTTTVEVTGAVEGAQTTGGVWSGSPHVLGVSYARHTRTILAGQNIVVRTSNSTTNPATNFGSVNGFQIVKSTDTPSTSFCLGDGTGAACPCGNNGAAGRGCQNASFSAGALLTSSGVAGASAGTDTLVLTAAGLLGPGLFFQSTGSAATPVPFGDGLLCATTGILRLGVVFPSAGSASYPGGLTPNPIHVGGATANGDTRHYQCWYRDGLVFCTPATSNLTQAISLVWGP
ncbi:MAG: hypothetical protein JNL28_17070 [Planctomycetes bacterium]|nr:hypothetical protein [Planctomycetota bacterium]